MITYFDTSIPMKLLIDDETFGAESERLWVESDFAVCAELAAMRRNRRLGATQSARGQQELELLWEQMSVVVVDTDLVRAAGGLGERDALRGWEAVHLAAAVAGQVTVVASADRRLVEAASRRGFAVAEPP